jgi:dehydrogenase/reductase SDR family member 12
MSGQRSIVSRVVDASLELPVAPSFTRIGPMVRSRLDAWTALDSYDLSGRTMVVTGATSGIGRHVASRLAGLGAHVIAVGRDDAKLERVVDELCAEAGRDSVVGEVADLGDLEAVRSLGVRLCAAHPVLHVLVHNAGALTADRRISPQDIEITVASQVVGPHLLTTMLQPSLRAAAPGRVITVSSGGMYAAALCIDDLQMGDDYRGAEQYARAKRAQVTLNEMWAQRVPADEVVFHAMHPGWADTPGVATALPTFRKVVGPLLRTPDQGADSIVWLAADPGAPLSSSGAFWLDRIRRPIHRLPRTRRSDAAERRAALWSWVSTTAGIDATDLPG